MIHENKVPQIYQGESAECGLACILMLASYHGYQLDLTTFRKRFPSSKSGATLIDLIDVCASIGLQARAVKADVKDLEHLEFPSILHWNFDHFVVLVGVKKGIYEINDPSCGVKYLKKDEVSKKFTGVAVEAIPSSNFKKEKKIRKVSLKELLSNLNGAKKNISKILLISIIVQFTILLVPLYGQFIIDNILINSDMTGLNAITLVFLFLIFFQFFAHIVRNYSILYFSTNMKYTLTKGLYGHLFKLPLEFFERRNIGDVISRFKSIDSIKHVITNTAIEAVIDGFFAIILMLLMFIYSPQLAITSFLLACLYLAIRLFSYKKQMYLNEDAIQKNAVQSGHFIEKIRSVQTIKLFAKENVIQRDWEKYYIDSLNSEVEANKLEVILNQLGTLIFAIASISILYFSVHQYHSGSMSIGMIFVFIAYNNIFVLRVSELIKKIISFKMLDLHLTRLSDIALTNQENLKSEIQSDFDYKNIVLNNISFKYSKNEPYVFNNVTLEICRGETVAITGSSGSGKTTLIKLMLGLLKPTKGEILIDGISLNRLNLFEFRNRVATVMQEDHLLSGSIIDNISFFSSEVDVERVYEVAKIACIHDEICKFPMGYNTLISNMGSLLSGGQKQRILLARALYHNPIFLFLDESTANLDINLEKRINKNLKQISVTKIVVAHRTETIHSADRVYDLELKGDI